MTRPYLVIDPAIQAGWPTIPGTRITAEALAEHVLAGDPVDFVAETYSVDRDMVLLACWWEAHQALRRPASYRDAWERLVGLWGPWYDALPWPWDFDAMPDPPAEETR